MLITKVKLKKTRGGTSLPTAANWFAALSLLCSLMAWSAPIEAAKIQYKFNSWSGPELRVNVTRPLGLAPDRPVVFVMYGFAQNTAKYREQWHQMAIEHDFLLVAPEISRTSSEKDPLGSLFDGQGAIKPDSIWSYAAIEAVFDEVLSHFSMSVSTYSLYGYSEGAQFVQRFVYYAPTARVDRIVVANANWYMMPDFDAAFPYGLGQSAIDRNRLEKSLQIPLTILLAEEDTDAEESNLRLAPEVMAQGPDRAARGRAFFSSAREAANEMDTPFRWNLETIERTGHNNRMMPPAAMPFLLGSEALLDLQAN